MPDESLLTHVDETGAARMIDVSAKTVSTRRAIAAGRVVTTVEVIELLRAEGLPKGDALAVARLAGIMGAKRTPDLIPLCHPIGLHGVVIDISLTGNNGEITAMIDMIKAVDPAASIEGVRVLRKEGGKTGVWVRPEDRP